MLSILITVLVMVVVVYIIHLLLTWLQLPQPITQIAYIILALLVILWLVRIFGLA